MTTSAEARDWLDTGRWARDGRGRSWIFKLPTAAVVRGLQAVSASRAESFQLLACSRIREGGDSLSLYTALPIDRLSADGPWQYFVRSPSLSPTIPAPEPLPGVGWPATFAVNGLVLLHHPDPAPSNRLQSTIGVTYRVVNVKTGEQREHRGYDSIFKALKRELQTEMRKLQAPNGDARPVR